MKRRLPALLAGALLLAVAALAHLEFLHMAGFPDGHLTELERGRFYLVRPYVFACAALGLILLAAGWRGREPALSAALRRALALFAVLTAAVLLADHFYLQRFLDGGGGG